MGFLLGPIAGKVDSVNAMTKWKKTGRKRQEEEWLGWEGVCIDKEIDFEGCMLYIVKGILECFSSSSS